MINANLCYISNLQQLFHQCRNRGVLPYCLVDRYLSLTSLEWRPACRDSPYTEVQICSHNFAKTFQSCWTKQSKRKQITSLMNSKTHKLYSCCSELPLPRSFYAWCLVSLLEEHQANSQQENAQLQAVQKHILHC